MPDKNEVLGGEWVARARKMWRWMRNFRITGRGVRVRMENSEEACAITLIGSESQTRTEENTSGLFPVVLEMTSGSAGNQTSAASFVYTVKELGTTATVLGTGMSPTVARPWGLVGEAVLGTAYYDGNGDLVLFQAFEIPNPGNC